MIACCSSRNAKLSALLVLTGIFLFYKLNLTSLSLQWNKLYPNETIVKPKSRNETGDHDNDDGPSNTHDNSTDSELNRLEPILLPSLPDVSLIGRLRNSMGNVTFDSIFSNCLPTCQVQLIPQSPFWELQTLDCHGNTKKVGGDEFYITYTDQALDENNNNLNDSRPFYMKPFTAAAFITDLDNGRYQLDFQESPFSDQIPRTGEGIVAIYFQYTCRIGQMGPPSKEKWKNGGNSVAATYRTNVLSTIPPIRPFEIPTTSNDTYPKLLSYDAIVPVGDSMIIQFLSPVGITLKSIHTPLNMTTLKTWKTTIQKTFQEQCKKPSCKKVAFILGSCVWDILEVQTSVTSTIDGSNGWMNHQRAFRQLLLHFNATFPKSTIYWKSCASLHIHIPFLYNKFSAKQKREMEQRTKYMSTSRTMDVYSIQTQMIQEMQQQQQSQFRPRVVLLDVYGAYFVSSHLAREGDGRHYETSLNQQIVHWFT